MTTQGIPDGYQAVSPYLTVQGAERVIAFLKATFDAIESERVMRPDGTVGHAEVRIAGSVVMIGEATGEWKPMPGALYVYVADADATYRRALAAGATSVMEPMTMFYGDRHGGVKDVAGNVWWIATRVETVSHEELQKRAAALFKQKR